MQDDVASVPVGDRSLARRKEKSSKVERIETALRIGDIASLRELASQPHGLIEGLRFDRIQIFAH